MVAHSGTLHALMLDPQRPDHAQRKREALAFLESLVPGIWFQVSNQALPHDERGLPRSPFTLASCADDGSRPDGASD